MLFENKVVYSFADNSSPIESLEAGETIIVEVQDIFNNQLSKTNKIEEINFDKINPATGPFYIHQALPNTMLKVHILEINLDNKGIGVVVDGLGVLGTKVHRNEVYRYDLSGTTTMFEEIPINLRPFISTIGVAPINKTPCGTPGNHGGKMDCPHATVGATLYLPVQKKGAYLALGGLKAQQGLGQLAGSGIECSGEIKVKVDVTNKFYLNMPIVKKEGFIRFLYSGKSLQTAIEQVTNEVATFIVENFNMSFNKAFHLVSILGDIEVYQLVNPNVTVGISLPKQIFDNYEIF